MKIIEAMINAAERLNVLSVETANESIFRACVDLSHANEFLEILYPDAANHEF